MKLEEIFWNSPDLTLYREDYAVTAYSSMPDFNPSYAKIVGTMDGHDVWATRYFGEYFLTFAFRNGDDVLAFIVLDTREKYGRYPLIRVWSKGGKETAGMPIALLVFVITKLQIKIIVTKDEMLTDAGWNWLIKIVQRERVKAFNADNNQPLTADDIKNDRDTAKNTHVRTNLSVALEGTQSRYPLFGTGYRVLSEMSLFIGDKTLI